MRMRAGVALAIFVEAFVRSAFTGFKKSPRYFKIKDEKTNKLISTNFIIGLPTSLSILFLIVILVS
jgi:hypothetical protein